MKSMTCCFTGHRKIPLEQYNGIVKRLRRILLNLIENGYVYFGIGGALGFDTLAAQTLLELKEVYPQIKLILVLPCKTQTKGWSNKDVAIYENIKNRADKCVYTSTDYTRGCMIKRNRHLVDNSSICIAYLVENKGGTAYTVEYARNNNVKVINISEES